MSSPHSKSRLLPRREFIKRTSLLGASALVVPSWLEAKPADGSAKAEMKNDHFSVSFNALKGTVDVLRSQGALLLSGGSACVNTLAGKQSIASPGTLRRNDILASHRFPASPRIG